MKGVLALSIRASAETSRTWLHLVSPQRSEVVGARVSSSVPQLPIGFDPTVSDGFVGCGATPLRQPSCRNGFDPSFARFRRLRSYGYVHQVGAPGRLRSLGGTVSVP